MDPVTLVLDLRISHERWGGGSDPSINGHLHYPNDIDRSLNEAVTDKIRKYPYIIIISLTVSSLCLICLVRLGGYMVNLCVFYFTNSSGN